MATLLTTLKKRFDRIYVLTMSNRQDRRNLMESQFKQLGLPLPDETPYIRYYFGTPFPHNGIICDAFNRSRKGRFTKPNEYDCSRNHYSINRISYDLGLDHILVLEDDVLLLNSPELLSEYIESIPEDFDIIQGGGFTVAQDICKLMKESECKWFKHKHIGLWNASFYGMSRRGMEFYRVFMDEISFWVADGPLFKAPLSDNVINTYASTVPLAVQADKDEILSDIRDKSNDSIDYNNQNMYERDIDLKNYFSVQ